MFATRHAVFVGPGKVPDELRQVLLERVGSPQPDVAIQVPRLLSCFDSAADAERVASQVQRLKLGVAIAGPEQPPAEDGWLIARALQRTELGFRVTLHTGDALALAPQLVTAVTTLDWRPAVGAPDRAVLLTLRDSRPLLLRASRLDTVSAHSLPLEGIKRINELLDDVGAAGAALRVRSRRLAEADFAHGALTGDLLPLALAVVDGVDSSPAELPRPLGARATGTEAWRSHYTALASLVAWLLYAGSLGGLVGSLLFFTLAITALSLPAALFGLSLGAWSTRRFMWSRWFGRATWGDDTPIPAFPISAGEPGIVPRPLELVLDAALVGAAGGLVLLSDGLPQQLGLWALPCVLVGVFTSIAAVYEAWQRA